MPFGCKAWGLFFYFKHFNEISIALLLDRSICFPSPFHYFFAVLPRVSLKKYIAQLLRRSGGWGRYTPSPKVYTEFFASKMYVKHVGCKVRSGDGGVKCLAWCTFGLRSEWNGVEARGALDALIPKETRGVHAKKRLNYELAYELADASAFADVK